MNLEQRIKDLEKEVDELRFKLEESNKLFIKGFEILKDISRGTIRNHYHKSIFGIGYVGIGIYRSMDGRHMTPAYLAWRNMMIRCYDSRYQEKYSAYKGCTVAEEWHNFQNFAGWFYTNFNPDVMQGWHLDKDLLVKGNKSYSSETCCFLPAVINTMLVNTKASRGSYPIGVSIAGKKFKARCNINGMTISAGLFDAPEDAFYAYKKVKENELKRIAEKWKNLIGSNAYEALIRWQIEITD